MICFASVRDSSKALKKRRRKNSSSMNLCFALCCNLKSRWSWGEIWRAPLPVFHLTGEKATGMKRLKKVFFLGTGADRFVYSSIIRQTGWCKDGKMRSLKQFTIAQAISLHRISFFSHFFASRHSQNISVSTQNTSLAPPKRGQRKKRFPHRILFSVQLQYTLITSDDFRWTSKVHDTKVAQVMLA